MQQIRITKRSNSLGFRTPRGIAESTGIEAGDTPELTPSENGLLIRKAAAVHRGGHGSGRLSGGHHRPAGFRAGAGIDGYASTSTIERL